MQTDIDTQQGSSVCARLRIVGWIVLTMAVALLAVTVTMRSIMTAQPFTSMHSLMERYLARQQPMAGEDIVVKAEGKVATTGNTADHAGRLLEQDPVLLDRILASEKTSGVSNSKHGTVRWAKAVAQEAGRPTAPMILYLGTVKKTTGLAAASRAPAGKANPQIPLQQSIIVQLSLASSSVAAKTLDNQRGGNDGHPGTPGTKGVRMAAHCQVDRADYGAGLAGCTFSMRSIMSGCVARPLTRAWCRKSKCSGPSPMRGWIRMRLALFSSIGELLERYLARQWARAHHGRCR